MPPLYIRDEAVSALVASLADKMGVNKTQAVKSAIESKLRGLKAEEPLLTRVTRLQERARALGVGPDGFDDKALMDELSGDDDVR